MTFKKPLGTVDFYPEDKEAQKKVFASLRNTAARFGFKEIESPAFESLGLLTKKSGEEITTQIFTLEQKGKESFGLRFDLTVPFTRMFMEKQKELPKPVKWYGISRMWRYERPQAGRLREFYQLSVEMFGADKPEADAEIINLAIRCLVDLGLTEKDFCLRINNRKLLQGLIESFAPKKNSEKLIAWVDKKEKVEEKEFLDGLKEYGIKDPLAFKKILEAKDLKELEDIELNDLGKQGLMELNSIIPLADKKFIQLNLSTARGLAYYTGTVFELFDKSGKYRALAGGGRYDNMVELLGGESCPATGFAIGYATLSLLLKDKGLLDEKIECPDYYVAMIGNDEVKLKALDIIKNLRKRYSVEYDIMGRSLGKQISQANTIKAKNLIVIGEDELSSEKVKIKDLATGKESEKELNSL